MAAKKKSVKKKKTSKKKQVTTKNENKKIEISIIKKFNEEAPMERHFILSNGKSLRSIFELINLLDNMEDEIFKFHVNKEKNDFSNWINDVFNEKALAKEINQFYTRMEVQNALLKHLIKNLKE